MIRFFTLLALLFAYTAFKFIEMNPDAPYSMILVSLLFFTLMIAPNILMRVRPEISYQSWFNIPTWIGSLFIGLWGTYIMISIPIDVVHLIYTFIFPDKVFLSPEAFGYIFMIASMMSLLGLIEVWRGPKVVNTNISILNLPENLQGLKIAQISDLHIGPTIQSRYVSKVVAKTNNEDPDLIVITGDLVDSHTDLIKEHLQPLKDLKSRFGVYYVTGNHEYYWGIDRLLPELKKVGINILSNTNQIIEVGNSKILLAGIPDPMAGSISKNHRPNIDEARKSSEDTQLNILLAHRPDPYHEASQKGFHLQFSGHTHAGQFFPFSLLIPLAHKYYRGLNQHENLKLYVNPGTGYWGPANRFGIASEITLAELSAE